MSRSGQEMSRAGAKIRSPNMLSGHEITDLPAFNDLQIRIRQYLAGHAAWEAVREAEEAVDRILGAMLATFHQELRYQVPTPELEELALAIYEEFSLLRVDLPLAIQCCEAHDEETALEHLEAARASLQLVLKIMARLVREDRARPRLSPIPLAHEVLRVGQLVLEEALDPQLLSERVEQYRLLHDRLTDALPGLEPSGAEAEVWEASQSGLKSTLKLQDGALKALDQALQRGDPELLEIGLEQLAEASEELAAVHQALVEAGNRPTSRLCPRCGRDCELTARHCGSCGAQLPMRNERSTFELAEQSPDHPAPLLQQLLVSAEAYANHELSREELLDEVEGTQARLNTVLQRLKRLKAPPPETPEEELKLLKDSRADLEAGLQLLAEGLDELRRGYPEGARQIAEATERLLGTHYRMTETPSPGS